MFSFKGILKGKVLFSVDINDRPRIGAVATPSCLKPGSTVNISRQYQLKFASS